MANVELCWVVVLLWLSLWILVGNAKLHGILNDDELPLFTGNNGDVGLCLEMDGDCCEYVIIHLLSHIYLHTLWWPGLANCEEGLCLVDASIYWQIFKMGVMLQWYHMNVHCNWVAFDVASWVMVMID